MHNSNAIDQLEKLELIQKLMDRGYGSLIEALLGNERKVYTKKGRLNKSGACRVLGWKPKELEEALAQCREILKRDIFTDDEEDDEEDDKN
jgi:nucleoside-diphosphate-sugar epimerase